MVKMESMNVKLAVFSILCVLLVLASILVFSGRMVVMH